uniref:50S ribosomal protein L30 n=1 Tax=uncultured delta proteobacterium Rifle_16ft_4_minimus_10129 TaxID=1665172 RepID=A0A0H4T228_9DELT|nr:50S ribosomal protein L30 [uncultured delta proteobacterium Rifle_16ft_4_minimus_10129]
MTKKKEQLIKITLKRSGIGCPQRQRKTLLGLGLRKLNSSSILKDTPSIRGMIEKVRHLVVAESV